MNVNLIQIITLLIAFLAVFVPVIVGVRNKKVDERQKSAELLINLSESKVDEIGKAHIELECLRSLSRYEYGTNSFFEGTKVFRDPVAAIQTFRQYGHFYPKFPSKTSNKDKVSRWFILPKFLFIALLCGSAFLLSATLAGVSGEKIFEKKSPSEKVISVENISIKKFERSGSDINFSLGLAEMKNANKQDDKTGFSGYLNTFMWSIFFTGFILVASVSGYVFVYILYKFTDYLGVSDEYIKTSLEKIEPEEDENESAQPGVIADSIWRLGVQSYIALFHR